VIVDPADYKLVAADLDVNAGATSIDTRARLAAKAFAAHRESTTRWCRPTCWPTKATSRTSFRPRCRWSTKNCRTCATARTRINRRRSTREIGLTGSCVANARMLQGKELSFNNIADTDNRGGVRAGVCGAGLRHRQAQHNPCGVATACRSPTLTMAYRTIPPPPSAGIIAFNRELDEATAIAIAGRQFVEVHRGAVGVRGCRRRAASKQNVRVLVIGALAKTAPSSANIASVVGGLLVQSRDTALAQPDTFKIVTQLKPRPRSSRTVGSRGACAST